jgi:hypothetical protein
MAIVYKTTNLINGKMYIGVDSKNDKTYLGSGKILKKSISKYGIENFRKEIIMEFKTDKEAYEYEKIYISEMNAVSSEEYYNIQEGGKGGWSHIDARGNLNPMFGKSTRDSMIEKYGEEEGNYLYEKSRIKAGIKISESLKGKNKSEEHKNSLSKAKKDFWSNLSEEEKIERRKKMSIDMKSANIIRSEEYKNKMSESIKSKKDQIHRRDICQYCNKEMNIANLIRWHGDKCKMKK